MDDSIVEEASAMPPIEAPDPPASIVTREVIPVAAVESLPQEVREEKIDVDTILQQSSKQVRASKESVADSRPPWNDSVPLVQVSTSLAEFTIRPACRLTHARQVRSMRPPPRAAPRAPRTSDLEHPARASSRVLFLAKERCCCCLAAHRRSGRPRRRRRLADSDPRPGQQETKGNERQPVAAAAPRTAGGRLSAAASGPRAAGRELRRHRRRRLLVVQGLGQCSKEHGRQEPRRRGLGP